MGIHASCSAAVGGKNAQPLPLFDAADDASSSAAIGNPHTDYTDFVIPFLRGVHYGSSPSDQELVASGEPRQPAAHPPGLYETQAAGANAGDGGGAVDRTTPSIASIIALRQRHHAKGHTPASDQRHGPAFFTNGTKEFIADAFRARSPEKRRGQLVAAAAMLVALIDRDDFAAALAAQQEEADSE